MAIIGADRQRGKAVHADSTAGNAIVNSEGGGCIARRAWHRLMVFVLIPDWCNCQIKDRQRLQSDRKLVYNNRLSHRASAVMCSQ